MAAAPAPSAGVTPAGSTRASLSASIEVGLCVSGGSTLCCTGFELFRSSFSASFSASFAARVSSRCNTLHGGGEGCDGGGDGGGGGCSLGGGGGGEGSGDGDGLGGGGGEGDGGGGRGEAAGTAGGGGWTRGGEVGAGGFGQKLQDSHRAQPHFLLTGVTKSVTHQSKQPGASGGGEVSEGAQTTLRWDQAEA
jgi:hypothetical protein